MEGLPCPDAQVPECLRSISCYVEQLQRQARESRERQDVEVARLTGEVDRLQREVDSLHQLLQQEQERERRQDQQAACLAEQLAAAGRAAEVAARAHEEQQCAAALRAAQAQESCTQYALRLAQAEQQGKEAAAEVQKAHESVQQLRMEADVTQAQLRAVQLAAETEAQLLRDQLAAAQQRLRQEQEGSSAPPTSDLAHMAQVQAELAAVQQQLEQERRMKEEALEGKARYKKMYRDTGEAFRRTRNAYMRLRKEKGVRGSVLESALWPSRDSGSSGRVTPDREGVADPSQGSGSEQEQQHALPPLPGMPAAKGSSGLPAPTLQQQRPGDAQGSLPQEGAGSRRTEPALSTHQLTPAAAHAVLAESASATKAAAAAQPGGQQCAAAATTPAGAAVGWAEDAAEAELAACGARQLRLAPPQPPQHENSRRRDAEAPMPAPAPEPLRPMNPPPPRPHLAVSAAAAANVRGAEAPAAQPQPAPPVTSPSPPSPVGETQTQPDTFKPLHQLARTPQTQRGLKRPSPPPPSAAHEPVPALARQLPFGGTEPPSWGLAGAQSATSLAEPPSQGGPAWKKAVRPDSVAQRSFDLMDGVPSPPVDGRPWQQPQQAGQRPLGGALLQQPLQPQLWQGGPVDGDPARAKENTAGGSGTGYKYQEVVRSRDERQKLKGVECLQCQRFYEALQTWGTIAAAGSLPGCGHVSREDLGGAGAGAPRVSREDLRQASSRHRFRYVPPPTPDEFWNMGFGTGE